MKLITIIADHNRHDDTLACLKSLEGCASHIWRVIVIDNGSEQPLLLPAGTLNIQLIRLEFNSGFSAAFNLGIQHALGAGADAILVLNNDTLVASNFLVPLLSALDSGAGIVAPRIYYASDPTRIWAEGFAAHSWTLEIRKSTRGKLERAETATPQSVDYVTGCAMLVSRRVFDAIGLFDERFFAYYEDFDFCIRARQAGFQIMIVPSSRVWHKVSTTTGLDTPRRQYLMARSSVLFFAKHAGRRWPVIVAYRTGSLIKTLANLAWHRRLDLIAAHIKGIRDGWRDAQHRKKR